MPLILRLHLIDLQQDPCFQLLALRLDFLLLLQEASVPGHQLFKRLLLGPLAVFLFEQLPLILLDGLRLPGDQAVLLPGLLIVPGRVQEVLVHLVLQRLVVLPLHLLDLLLELVDELLGLLGRLGDACLLLRLPPLVPLRLRLQPDPLDALAGDHEFFYRGLLLPCFGPSFVALPDQLLLLDLPLSQLPCLSKR